jgi:iron(III) transport system ATP-binding protein
VSSEGRPVITIRGLTKAYKKGATAEADLALKGIDLDVMEGEFLILLGPSGCGKTTLLRSIAGLEQPTGGTIAIDGQEVFNGAGRIHVDAERRPISMIFQSYALWPHMTAAQNVAFPLQCAKVKRSEIKTRVDEILNKVGIGHLGDRYPSQMSGGQQQRLALARALVVGKRIVLFDEPLSNVDAQVREQLRYELVSMQRTLGFTAIYVTHDQTEAMELADRLAVMSLGRISQLDEPQVMYDSPRDIHVARFLGQSNEIRFTVDAASGSTVTGQVASGDVVSARIAGESAASVRSGQTMSAFGRLADFTIGAPGSKGTGPAANDWPGTIVSERFLGTHWEVLVNAAGQQLRCWLPPEGHMGYSKDTWVTVHVGMTALKALSEDTP